MPAAVVLYRLDSANCTTTCHDGTTGTQDHSAAITDSGNVCNGCHTLTEGASDSANISSAENKQHDECSTCHNFDTGWEGKLVTAPGTRGVDTMIGGDCTGCHDAPDDWTSMHLPVTPVHSRSGNGHWYRWCCRRRTMRWLPLYPPPLVDAGDATVHNALRQLS